MDLQHVLGKGSGTRKNISQLGAHFRLKLQTQYFITHCVHTELAKAKIMKSPIKHANGFSGLNCTAESLKTKQSLQQNATFHDALKHSGRQQNSVNTLTISVILKCSIK